MIKIKIFLLLSFLFFVMRHSRAALYSDDTSTTKRSHSEVEFSLDYYKDVEKEYDPETDEYDKEVSKEKKITATLYYGLTDNSEIGLAIPYKFMDGTSSGEVSGFSDIIIGAKYRLWEEGNYLPSFAFSLDLKTNSANKDKGLGTGEKDLSLNNIFTKTMAKIAMDLNLGYTFVGDGSDDIFFYSLDLSRDLTKKISLCNEIYGETTLKEDFDKNIFCWGLSLSYEVNKIISLESGVGIGISKASPDYQLSNKITFNF